MKKLECPKCGHELKVIHEKKREFLKCSFCGLESRNKRIYSFPLAELGLAVKTRG